MVPVYVHHRPGCPPSKRPGHPPQMHREDGFGCLLESSDLRRRVIGEACRERSQGVSMPEGDSTYHPASTQPLPTPSVAPQLPRLPAHPRQAGGPTENSSEEPQHPKHPPAAPPHRAWAQRRNGPSLHFHDRRVNSGGSRKGQQRAGEPHQQHTLQPLLRPPSAPRLMQHPLRYTPHP